LSHAQGGDMTVRGYVPDRDILIKSSHA
jgi:hypothetical protein